MPFAAIKAFLDPSVQFGLTFETGETPAAANPQAPVPPAAPAPKAKDRDKDKDKAESKSPDKPAAATEDKPHDGEHKPSEGAEVVRLDRFRKK